MIKKQSYLLILLALFIFSCDQIKENSKEKVEEQAKSVLETFYAGDILINQVIKAHGGVAYDSAHFQFVFRDITYRFQNKGEEYIYEREGVIKGDSIHDILNNGQLSRVKNGVQVNLEPEEAKKYAESINSVIYFATLPYKLKDEAVIPKIKDTIQINAIDYQVIQVKFKQEGGGTDFEDEYYYWINEDTKEIDFLAYNYQVNGGGVRFRSAYNKRRVNGILFQDYINYKAPVGTPLNRLPNLWESNRLEELSRIETESIQAICSRFKELGFLIGVWKNKKSPKYETWKKVNDTLYTGSSYRLSGDKKLITETLSLKKEGNEIIYTATVFDQNEGKAIDFVLNRKLSSVYSFENALHDFPKKIQYHHLNNDELKVQVVGNKEQSFEVYFEKVAEKK